MKNYRSVGHCVRVRTKWHQQKRCQMFVHNAQQTHTEHLLRTFDLTGIAEDIFVFAVWFC